jgi:hypothetical protein
MLTYQVAPLVGETQSNVAAESYDPLTSNFDWALFDDFNWPLTFDASIVTQA